MAEHSVSLLYLNEFRVEQCQAFKTHSCPHHKPFTCFNYHFANQRRRRSVRNENGSYNYSSNIYCEKYDETMGCCPDSDECPFLHRVAGDVERKYHMRYFKTVFCVHSLAADGHCAKNGQHCAFAHSRMDLRQPPRDGEVSEYATQLADDPNHTRFVIDDEAWRQQDYVLSFYKTEPCQKPERVCRQGYACPYYHSARDKRRPPHQHTYRSTACPSVKSSEEWAWQEGRLACASGDGCVYAHSRTEQQFHPDVYKSTKCNDILERGYCPRSIFCAFAHSEEDMKAERNLITKQKEKEKEDSDDEGNATYAEKKTTNKKRKGKRNGKSKNSSPVGSVLEECAIPSLEALTLSLSPVHSDDDVFGFSPPSGPRALSHSLSRSPPGLSQRLLPERVARGRAISCGGDTLSMLTRDADCEEDVARLRSELIVWEDAFNKMRRERDEWMGRAQRAERERDELLLRGGPAAAGSAEFGSLMQALAEVGSPPDQHHWEFPRARERSSTWSDGVGRYNPH